MFHISRVSGCKCALRSTYLQAWNYEFISARAFDATRACDVCRWPRRRDTTRIYTTIFPTAAHTVRRATPTGSVHRSHIASTRRAGHAAEGCDMAAREVQDVPGHPCRESAFHACPRTLEVSIDLPHRKYASRRANLPLQMTPTTLTRTRLYHR